MVKSVIIDSMNKNTPEYYGYKLGENIAPYINKCIDETGECFIAEGTHIVGRNDTEWNKGHVWSDSSIVWGWNKKNNIKIIGAGKDKTILKYVDNVNTRFLFGTDAPIVYMLTTNYDASCDNNLIEGITFDGNYENNHDISTVCCIRIRGANNIIRNCKFINFGPGDKSNHECFQVFVVPVNKGDKGSHVLNCEFISVGNKKNSPSGHCPENTMVAVGGRNPTVKNNIFKNGAFDIVNQQSPIHAITAGESIGAEISENLFENYQGACFYVDSWTNIGTIIRNNKAINVWNFIVLTCQRWTNEAQISFNKDFIIEDNEISLSNGNVYYQWDLPPISSIFFCHNHEPQLNKNLYPAFDNILIKNNKITLGYREVKNNIFEESYKVVGFMGGPVGENKIKLENNTFISTVPKVEKLSLWQRFVTFIKKLFRF